MYHPLTHDLLKWYDEHKRSLPWRDNRTPYGTLVSEIMLQQTRVDTVIPYYNAFMEKFPTVEDLATAEQDTVLSMWSGLGYYSRARNLHKAAKQVVEAGEFPNTLEGIRSLNGVGEYIAGAIASMAFDLDVGAVDGNLHRVLSRIHCDGGDRKKMWGLIEPLLPAGRCGDFNQALMDLGSSICKKTPVCTECPIKSHCTANLEERTDEFPVVKKKKAKKEEAYVALVIRSAENPSTILMAQRTAEALYGGMVEPCLISDATLEPLDAATWVQKYLPDVLHGGTEQLWIDKGGITHILTHKKMYIRVLECVLSEDVTVSKPLLDIAQVSYKSIDWYTTESRNSVGISTLATKILSQTQNPQLSLF